MRFCGDCLTEEGLVFDRNAAQMKEAGGLLTVELTQDASRRDIMEKVKFQLPGTEDTVDFFVLEQTRLGGRDYLLVTESEEGDADAYILKDLSRDGEAEAVYEMVEQEEELEALSAVFGAMLEDADLVL